MEATTLTVAWPSLELRHLSALDSVVRNGSFGRAAAELGYTQSAVSQQIAAFERIVGTPLVHRPSGRGRAVPTAAGEILLRHAEAITARLAAAKADLAALDAGEAGELRIGTYQSIGARLLPAVMRRFLLDWPRIEIHLSEPATDEDFSRLLARGDLDLVLCSLPLPPGPFDSTELLEDPYVLLVPVDSPYADRESLSLGSLGPTPVIGCSATGTKLEASIRASGHTLDFAFRSDDNGTLQGLVGAGFGVALLPSLAVAPDDPRVRALRLEEAVPPRRLAIAWHRDRHRTPASLAFVDAAVEAAKGFGG